MYDASNHNDVEGFSSDSGDIGVQMRKNPEWSLARLMVRGDENAKTELLKMCQGLLMNVAKKIGLAYRISPRALLAEANYKLWFHYLSRFDIKKKVPPHSFIRQWGWYAMRTYAKNESESKYRELGKGIVYIERGIGREAKEPRTIRYLNSLSISSAEREIHQKTKITYMIVQEMLSEELCEEEQKVFELTCAEGMSREKAARILYGDAEYEQHPVRCKDRVKLMERRAKRKIRRLRPKAKEIRSSMTTIHYHLAQLTR